MIRLEHKCNDVSIVIETNEACLDDIMRTIRGFLIACTYDTKNVDEYIRLED